MARVCLHVAALLGAACFSATHGYSTDYHDFVRGRQASAGQQQVASAPLLHLHWMAPLMSGGGYSSEAMTFVMGLMKDDTPPHVGLTVEQHGDSINADYVRGLPALEYQTLNRLTTRPPQGVISVCHSEPGAWQISPALPQRYRTSICPLPHAAYTVGRTMFETDRLPEGWAARLNGMDEVWVPTAFARRIFTEGGVAPTRLLVLPEAVDSEFFNPAMVSSPPLTQYMTPRVGCSDVTSSGATQYGGSPACPFRMLSVGKWERRKNFEALLRATLTEFTHKVNGGAAAATASESVGVGSTDAPQVAQPYVELYILTSAYHSTADFEAAVNDLIHTKIVCRVGGESTPDEPSDCLPQPPTTSTASLHPGVTIHLLHDIPQSQLPLIYASVDAFVSPTRGEGWGRPHVEAMSMGLPVIATNWSGITEYLHEGNGYPIRVSHLAPIPDGAFAGHMVAEVDVSHLRHLLRHVYEHQDEAREKGARAREDMATLYHPTALAQFISHQVARISELVAARQAAADAAEHAHTHAHEEL